MKVEKLVNKGFLGDFHVGDIVEIEDEEYCTKDIGMIATDENGIICFVSFTSSTVVQIRNIENAKNREKAVYWEMLAVALTSVKLTV